MSLCAFLFSWPCLRVEEEEEEEEEEQPVTEPNSEEEREDDAPCQGKDRYRGLDPPWLPLKAWRLLPDGEFAASFSSLLPSSLAPFRTGSLHTQPQSD